MINSQKKAAKIILPADYCGSCYGAETPEIRLVLFSYVIHLCFWDMLLVLSLWKYTAGAVTRASSCEMRMTRRDGATQTFSITLNNASETTSTPSLTLRKEKGATSTAT